jgi:deoxyribose-phosphate aldolase
VPTVDQVMAEERAAAFTRRSIKTSAKLDGLKLAVSMMDLTTLEGNDTPGKIAFLCRKAMQPLDPRYQVSSCAAVCVYPNLVSAVRDGADEIDMVISVRRLQGKRFWP